MDREGARAFIGAERLLDMFAARNAHGMLVLALRVSPILRQHFTCGMGATPQLHSFLSCVAKAEPAVKLAKVTIFLSYTNCTCCSRACGSRPGGMPDAKSKHGACVSAVVTRDATIGCARAPVRVSTIV